MDETEQATQNAQDAAEAAQTISTLSDYEKVREALVADSAEAWGSDNHLPFEREPTDAEVEESAAPEVSAADAASPETEVKTESEAAPPEPTPRPRSNKAKKVKDRIDKVVWEREEARKEVAQLRQQIETLQAPPAAEASPDATATAPAGQTATDAAPQEDREPAEADYTDYGAFVTAKARWAARQELSSAIQVAHQHERQASQQQHYQNRAAAFSKKMSENGTDDPAFLATIQPEILNLRPAMSLKEGEAPTGATAIADLLMDSEHPQSMMSYLSSHEDDFRRISALHPMLAMRELGRIEVGLDAAPNGSASPPVSSQAQPPIRPVGSSSARTAASQRSPEDITSVAEWERVRKRLLHER
jgi:hypothetical protein